MIAPRQAALTFSPVPGSYSATSSPGQPVSFIINASAPVVWNWSVTGSLVSSNVANGGTSNSITFSLSKAGLVVDKVSDISVSVDANAWSIELTAQKTDPNP
jgi:hypothetical protein